MLSIKTKYFPWAPAIPFKIKAGRYLLPELSQDAWQKAFSNNDIVATCFGGLFESYYSGACHEALNKLLPGKTLYWSGNEKFNLIIPYGALAQSKSFIEEVQVKKYPTPIFFDKDGHTYINCLLNYIDKYTFKGDYIGIDKNPVSFQLFRNIMVEWSRDYLPQLRNFEEPEDIKKFIKTNKFNMLKPFILLIPERTGVSMHEERGIDWGMQEVRSFISMIRPMINVVIATDYPHKYNKLGYFIKPSIENILYLIQKSSYILSNEIDYLLISLMLGNNILICNSKPGNLNINANKEYLKSENKIYCYEKVEPFAAYEVIKESIAF
jgi:hypothetical protein